MTCEKWLISPSPTTTTTTVSLLGFFFQVFFFLLYLFFVLATTINWTTTTATTSTQQHQYQHLQHFNQPPSHSARQNGDGSNSRKCSTPLETRHVLAIGFLFQVNLPTNDGLGSWDKRGYVFFFIIYIFNYTNGYLKVLYLQMETLGTAGKADGGLRINEGSGREMSRVPGMFYFFTILMSI